MSVQSSELWQRRTSEPSDLRYDALHLTVGGNPSHIRKIQPGAPQPTSRSQERSYTPPPGNPIMASQETFHPAFSSPMGNLPFMPIDPTLLPIPSVSYGLPFPEACAEHIQHTLHASRVYIICSGTLARMTGPETPLQRLISAIGEEHVVGVRRGMAPHTLWSEIIEIASEAKEATADCLVTLGAGSLTDAAKIITMCLANNIRTPAELANYSVESKSPLSTVHPPTVPIINIPTSLSGGEYFPLAGGTDDTTHHKQAFLHPGMGSTIIILDPELCLLTPEYYWLSTGVRSLDHCVEALCSLEATAISDNDAETGLRLLVPSLLRCKDDPRDVDARHKCQMAVILAMKSVRAGIPMGGSHAIGHQLGPLGVPHGVTSCIMCPAVMKYNIKHAGDHGTIKQKQAKVLQILWSEATIAAVLRDSSLQEDTADLGDVLDIIIRKLGLPRSLAEMGLGQTNLDPLASRALDDFWAPTNPVPLMKAEQVKEILLAVQH